MRGYTVFRSWTRTGYFPATRIAMLWSAVLLLLPLLAVRAESVPTDVANAALAQDWTKVAEALNGVDAKTKSAELRIIAGHACLATNHNNRSLELFASALNDADRTAWMSWAERFASEHPENAIAWYFKGDAHARRREWNEAERTLEQALRLDKQCYLAWNARGIVAHAVGNTLMARMYFLRAVRANEDFADAYANRGTLNVFRNSVHAQEDFVTARSRSHDKSPILPIIGLGCALYGQEDYEQARKHFDSIPEASAMWSLAKRNGLAAELGKLSRAVQDAVRSSRPCKFTLMAMTTLTCRSRKPRKAPTPQNGGSPASLLASRGAFKYISDRSRQGAGVTKVARAATKVVKGAKAATKVAKAAKAATKVARQAGKLATQASPHQS